MKGERIKVKNIEELKEKLKSEKKDNILVKLIFSKSYKRRDRF